MKKLFRIICCVCGSVMIVFFANKLNTIMGVIFFVIGLVMLVSSSFLNKLKNKTPSVIYT